MKLLDRLPWFSRRHVRKLEAGWRVRVHEARVPYVVYYTGAPTDPTAIYIDMEEKQWIN